LISLLVRSEGYKANLLAPGFVCFFYTANPLIYNERQHAELHVNNVIMLADFVSASNIIC